jgi:hypothetical protein
MFGSLNKIDKRVSFHYGNARCSNYPCVVISIVHATYLGANMFKGAKNHVGLW